MQPDRRTLLTSLAAALLVSAAPAYGQSYEAALAQYTQARAAYDEAASASWDDVAEKRRGRNAKRRINQPAVAEDYVLTQPPVYSGPPRPVDPNAPGRDPDERQPVPLVADFLQAAVEQFGFVPDRPSEADFKRAYAKAALAAGLTRDQIVGVYAFETGGNGTYDMQAGVTPTRPRAISPAVGYNQLLSTNSVSILSEFGHRIVATLRQKSNTLTGPAKIAMERKIEALKRMITYSRSVPHSWSEFDRLAKTTAGGIGIHAVILDRDIGPMLQVQKLASSLHFALQRAAVGRRTRIDEPHRRRQRHRHGDDAAGLARARADGEFLPAERLRAQSGGAPHRHRRQSHCGYRETDGARRTVAGRAGTGGGVLISTASWPGLSRPSTPYSWPRRGCPAQGRA